MNIKHIAKFNSKVIIQYMILIFHLIFSLSLLKFQLSPLNLSGIVSMFPLYTLTLVFLSMIVSIIGLSYCLSYKTKWMTLLPYINVLCFFIEYNDNIVLQMIHTIGISFSSLSILLLLTINNKANHYLFMIGFGCCVFSISLTNNINMLSESILLLILNFSTFNLLFETTFNKRN